MIKVFISSLIFSSAACIMDFALTLESSQVFTVQGAADGEVLPETIIVEEQIYREESFPDPRYERIYHVQAGKQRFELGRYTDEAANGMTSPPQMVAGWLVVMSGAHLFFWRPEEEVRHFYPYVVDGWIDYAQERQLNGHYDYAVTAVTIKDSTWQITYDCTSCLESQPAQVHFVSVDGGQTFRVVQ
ncbi:MAG TPA: hypothetical protein P5121_21410 [Caldilineaceae bacterium]|nr:hypothetical protein [Caldilineaceae bacterium]